MTDYIELGKRLVASSHFRWMGGMLTLCGIRVVEGGADYIIGYRSGPTKDGGGWVDTVDLEGIYPDLFDAATRGCLLGLVRDAWGLTAHLVRPSPEILEEAGFTDFGWALATGLASRPLLLDIPSRRYLLGKTEEETMVAALEAAP